MIEPEFSFFFSDHERRYPAIARFAIFFAFVPRLLPKKGKFAYAYKKFTVVDSVIYKGSVTDYGRAKAASPTREPSPAPGRAAVRLQRHGFAEKKAFEAAYACI